MAASGFNHGAADAASIPGGPPRDVLRVTVDRPTTTSRCCCLPHRRRRAGTSPAPPGWWLVQDAVGYLWPNGHQDRLRTAAGAWASGAESISGLAGLVPAAVTIIDAQQSPEIPHAAAACTAMGGHLTDLADGYRGLGAACSSYATHLDSAHTQILGELRSLIGWTAGIEILGGLFSLVTAGLSEAAAQAAEATRIAAAAARITDILHTLTDTVAPLTITLATLTTRIRDITTELRTLLAARITRIAPRTATRLVGLSQNAELIASGAGQAAAKTWNTESLSRSGARLVGKDLTRAGQKISQHGGQGSFPVPSGTPEEISRIGQQQLDDILNNPRTLLQTIKKGNFQGGRYFIAPDGRGASLTSMESFSMSESSRDDDL